MASLAINTRLGPLRHPRQHLNSPSLNSGKVEQNLNFETINRLTAEDCYGAQQESNHLKLVNTGIENMANQFTMKDIEVKTYVLKLLEDLESNINNDNFGKSTNELIANLCNYLKEHGIYLDEELSFKEQMDLYFNLLRNILRNPKLEKLPRALILEVIELRAANWVFDEDIDSYYRKKISDLESNDSYNTLCEMSRGLKASQSSGSIISNSNEVIKSSGKFVKPTKVPGKTFLKDEVVIRNCDSGKVMGIKGRRVHMIEEMSDTVISFQRVNPGAKERLVQITGPNEDNIDRAKELIESTIKRNASPVPFDNPSKASFDGSLNEVNDQINENQMFDVSNVENFEISNPESEKKMPYSFTVNVDDEVIQLSTKNYSIGHKVKKMLDQLFNSSNRNLEHLERMGSNEATSDSNSDDYRVDLKKEMANKTNTIMNTTKRDDALQRSLQRQSSAAKLNESFANKSVHLQRSSSQGTVPIGRTSMRYLNNKVNQMPAYVEHDIRQNLITYDRDFLMKCADSPLSRQMPSIFSKIASELPDIIRNGQKQSQLSNSLAINESAANIPQQNTVNNVYEQW